MNVSNSQKIFNTDCGICLESFKKNEENCALSKCGHVFHAACINPWLEQQGSCPTCRGKSIKPLSTKELAKLSLISSARAFGRVNRLITGPLLLGLLMIINASYKTLLENYDDEDIDLKNPMFFLTTKQENFPLLLLTSTGLVVIGSLICGVYKTQKANQHKYKIITYPE